MIFEKLQISSEEEQKLLLFDKRCHLTSWEHYYRCYSDVVKKIFSSASYDDHVFNYRSRPLLFLVRHNLELCLKHNLELNKIEIPNRHILSELLSLFPEPSIIPAKVNELVAFFEPYGDGACFRYDKNQAGNDYFVYKEMSIKEYYSGEVIKIGESFSDKPILLGKYISIYNSVESTEQFILYDIFDEFKYHLKRINNNLTFHMCESNLIGQIKTQYDFLIIDIVKNIQKGIYDIKLSYLPLLALLRHSIEIGLKYNLGDLENYWVPSIVLNKYSLHKLIYLYNKYGGDTGFLSEIDLSKLPQDTRDEFFLYKSRFLDLNVILHNLDPNSLHLRYPISSSVFNIPKKGIIGILEKFQATDLFISSSNFVLEESGVIEPK